jgi:uncharacterized protein (DUF1501 family)
MKRREFIKFSASLTLAGVTSWANSAQPAQAKRLLVIMLRGGMDGLAAIPPFADPDIGSLRSELLPSNLLPGNQFFGIHPALPTFAECMDTGQATAIHATGFRYTGRSHFEGQDIMQSGVLKPYASASGWLGRAMRAAQSKGGVAISIPMPLILRGDAVSETQYPSWMQAPPKATYELVSQLWANVPELKPYASRLIESDNVRLAADGTPEPNQQRRTAYSLAKEAAQKMQLPGGPVVGVLDFNGFDTHAGQGAAEGVIATKLKQIDDAIRGYREGIGASWAQSLVITVTEFGRTVSVNGTVGTDHGWGSCILAAGGLVKAKGIVSQWPGLKNSQLFEGRDLKVTVDALAIYADALQSVFGLPPEVIQKEVFSYARDSFDSRLFV